MTKILRTAASRLAQGGNKYAEQRKKAQRRLRKCKENELNDSPPQKLNYRLRLIFSIFLFSLLTFTLCTAPCAFAANGTLTQDDTDGYYLIEDAKDLAAFRDGVNDGTLASANARLTADIDLSVYTNWTPIGGEANKYAGTFDGRGHAINGLAVNMTDTGGETEMIPSIGTKVYAGLFGFISGTVKNLTVQGKVAVECVVEIIYAGGIAGRLENGTLENCKSEVSVNINNISTSYITQGGQIKNYVGGIVGHIGGGYVRNCESSGAVTSSTTAGGNCYGNAGGIAGVNDGGEITNCTSSGAVEAYSKGNFTEAGGIVAGNQENSTVSNCVSYSSVKADGYMTSRTGGIAGYNHGTLENCLVNAESVSGQGGADGPAAAIVHYNGSTGTVTNRAWVKNDNMPENGIGTDPDSTDVTGLDNADLLANAVTSLTASIDPSTITKEGTATITLTTGPKTPENAFDENSGAVRNIKLDENYNQDVVTVAPGENAASYTVTPVDFGATDIKITANLYATDFANSASSPTPVYTNSPTPYTFTLPVTVASEAAPSPSQPGASGGSGSTGGGGGGGCSAGFGALALLAAVPLLFRRKK